MRRARVAAIAVLLVVGGVRCEHSGYGGDTTNPVGVAGLPLVEVPTAEDGPALAVIVTGDGGWASLVRTLAHALAGHGIPVVGLSSPRYFWKKRTPDEASKDLTRILRHYLGAWQKERAILVGYSRGAGTVPFMVNRLPPDLRVRVELVALAGAGHRANFEFHLIDLVFATGRASDLPVLPEVKKLERTPLICVYGEKERDTVCPELSSASATVVKIPGGHRMSAHSKLIVEAVLQRAQ